MIEKIAITEAQKKARRSRSIALAVVLATFVLLVYFVSMVKVVTHS